MAREVRGDSFVDAVHMGAFVRVRIRSAGSGATVETGADFGAGWGVLTAGVGPGLGGCDDPPMAVTPPPSPPLPPPLPLERFAAAAVGMGWAGNVSAQGPLRRFKRCRAQEVIGVTLPKCRAARTFAWVPLKMDQILGVSALLPRFHPLTFPPLLVDS